MVQVGLLFISKTIATSDLVMHVLSVMLKAVMSQVGFLPVFPFSPHKTGSKLFSFLSFHSLALILF